MLTFQNNVNLNKTNLNSFLKDKLHRSEACFVLYMFLSNTQTLVDIIGT